MSEAVNVDVSPIPAQASAGTGNNQCPKITTLEQTHELGTGAVQGEASEEKHQFSSEDVCFDPAKDSSAVHNCVVIERSRLTTNDVSKNSVIEHTGPPPEDVLMEKNEEMSPTLEDVPKSDLLEHMGPHPTDIVNSVTEHTGPPPEDVLMEKNEEMSSTPEDAIKSDLLEHMGPHTADIVNSVTEHTEPPHEDVLMENNEEMSSTPEDATKSDLLEHRGPHPADIVNSVTEHTGPPPEDVLMENNEEMSSTPEDATKSDLLEHMRPHPAYIVNSNNEEMGSPPGDVPNSSLSEHRDATENSDHGKLASPREDVTNNSGTKQSGPPSEYATKDSRIELLGPAIEDSAKNLTPEQLKAPCKDEMSSQSGHMNKRTSSKSLKKKDMLQSVIGSDRVLRSKQEKPKAPEPEPEPSNNLADASAGKEKKRKKSKRVKKTLADEFSRIKRHLRYFLNRMSYEQNLIDAYSGEGWKRLSIDKLKPEKELQRAANEIFRCKLKIRDEFQSLDSICAEGKLPESLFDSDGQIDSEDIFCAKCGSKDFSGGNDIILCDGACDRGFHLFCLQPPLSLEEIPPDDEGWLCPGCDCKVDCIDLLNDSQGTTLSITDSWEKVFPEAAAGANLQDDNSSSDDSEDDDYDPDAKDVDQKVQDDDSSSDDSEFKSACDEFETPVNNEQLLGLSSDDSEDDDYNPTAPDPFDLVKQESSSSDFTSDSEDLAAVLDDNRPSRASDEQRSRPGGDKNQVINDELLTISQEDPGEADSTPVSGRRHVERLDYKKLYDETYRTVSSSSSDDEDWTDTGAPRKRRNRTGQVGPGSPKIEDTEHSSKRRTRQKLNLEATNNSPVKLDEGSPASGKQASNRRHGEAATQRLYESFKENQYPDRAAKENLAKELEMTVCQINKWFGNARWSYRHSPGFEARAAKSSSNKGTPSQIYKEGVDPESEKNTRDVISNGVGSKESPKLEVGAIRNDDDEREKKVATKESSGQKSTTANSRKRKSKSNLSTEETPKSPDFDSPNVGVQTRSRKSSS